MKTTLELLKNLGFVAAQCAVFILIGSALFGENPAEVTKTVFKYGIVPLLLIMAAITVWFIGDDLRQSKAKGMQLIGVLLIVLALGAGIYFALNFAVYDPDYFRR